MRWRLASVARNAPVAHWTECFPERLRFIEYPIEAAKLTGVDGPGMVPGKTAHPVAPSLG